MLILVGVVAITLGLMSYRIRSQQDSVYQLRELGGQLDVPDMDVLTWVRGMSVDGVQFLGPEIGDETIKEIGTASADLNVRQMTFFETRVTPDGIVQLTRALPNTLIRLVAPSTIPQPGLPLNLPDVR